MKILLVVLFAITSINCSKVKFNNDQLQEIQDLVDQGINLDDGDNDDEGDVDEDDGDLICPRYDLVVKSSHDDNSKLNYKFNYNGELKHTSIQGNIDVLFLKDGVKKFTQCSGAFINTNILKTLEPLKVAEKLTGEIAINHGMSCVAMLPVRTTHLQVVDSASGKILWDEKSIIQQIGACEFGYTEEGIELRSQLIDLADKVVNKMASDCNK